MFRFLKKSGTFYYPGQEIPLPEMMTAADKNSFSSLESGKNRLLFTAGVFLFSFGILCFRLFNVALNGEIIEEARRAPVGVQALNIKMKRADITDRNGVILATSLPSADLYAEVDKIKNPEMIAAALVQTLPDLKYKPLLKKLKSGRNFVYIKRALTPKEQYEVNRLGFPALNFQHVESRVYPQGALFAHIVGATDIDGKGIAGVEKAFNERLSVQKEPVRLSLDAGIQDTVRLALKESVEKFNAEGAAAVLMNAKTGEVVALVSLPDFDPNNLRQAKRKSLFNAATLGVYEVGSIMKLFNAAIGLETGKVKVSDTFDAANPIVLANYKIQDEPKLRRVLSLPEILIHSSNVGSARIALNVGAEKQQEYLRRFGFFQPASLEIPERGHPLYPSKWREVNTATAGYGYGVAVTPLHIAAATSALVNGGVYHAPSLLFKRNTNEIIGERVISEKTSKIMRAIMRLVVTEGSGRRANVPGYEVGGKTGSAQKIAKGKYVKNSLRTSFVSAFPMDNPQYVLMVMMEAPQRIKETFNFNTAAWNAVPTAERIISAVAPQLGITPRPYEPTQPAPYDKAALNAK